MMTAEKPATNQTVKLLLAESLLNHYTQRYEPKDFC
jgi:hypothetical protein